MPRTRSLAWCGCVYSSPRKIRPRRHALRPRLSSASSIRRFPELGRPVALAPQPRLVRDAVFGSYIVRYSVHAETVVVLRTWHHYEERQARV